MSTRVTLTITCGGVRRAHLTSLSWPRRLQSRYATCNYDTKYAEKLLKKAKEKGIDLCELKAQAQEVARREQKKQGFALKSLAGSSLGTRATGSSSTTPGTFSTRRDSSPVKPLSSILNIPKLVATPHTSSQISALWSAYHASRSGGTGRGFICAALPVETYEGMIGVAKRYPTFVLPVPRPSARPDTPETAHEFYWMQWDLHSPQTCAGAFDPFQAATSPPSDGVLPPISTVLFTPLQEYKHRAAFATPYLVLTFYTDLACSHGVVLLRGEITPSAATTVAAAATGGDTPGQYTLSQVDAQLLAMGLQRFYLWSENRRDGAEELLRKFHEKPDEFDWRELLQHSDVTV